MASLYLQFSSRLAFTEHPIVLFSFSHAPLPQPVAMFRIVVRNCRLFVVCRLSFGRSFVVKRQSRKSFTTEGAKFRSKSHCRSLVVKKAMAQKFHNRSCKLSPQNSCRSFLAKRQLRNIFTTEVAKLRSKIDVVRSLQKGNRAKVSQQKLQSSTAKAMSFARCKEAIAHNFHNRSCKVTLQNRCRSFVAKRQSRKRFTTEVAKFHSKSHVVRSL